MNLLSEMTNKEKIPFLFKLDSAEVKTNSTQDTLTIHESLPWAVSQNVVHSTMMDSSGRTDVNKETTDDE